MDPRPRGERFKTHLTDLSQRLGEDVAVALDEAHAIAGEYQRRSRECRPDGGGDVVRALYVLTVQQGRVAAALERIADTMEADSPSAHQRSMAQYEHRSAPESYEDLPEEPARP